MNWWTRCAVRRAARSIDRDLERELQDHVERRVRALRRAGVSDREARRLAALEIGGVEQVKEAVRDVRGTRWAHDLAQDVRLRRPQPAEAPRPRRGGDAVARPGHRRQHRDLLAGRRRAAARAAGARPRSARHGQPQLDQPDLGGGPAAGPRRSSTARSRGRTIASTCRPAARRDPVDGLFVSGGFFDTLGVQPALGRFLTATDDQRGGGGDGPTAVISHRFWQLRYGGDASVLGRTLLLDRVPVTIVGVAPARFLGPSIGRTFDVAVPIGLADRLRPGAQQSLLDGRSHWWLAVMFRLRDGQTIDAATAALRSVQPAVRAATIPQRWGEKDRASYLTGPFVLEPASTGRSELRTQYRRPLLVLMGMVGVVLLVACANVANLLLARGEVAAARTVGAARPGRLARPDRASAADRERAPGHPGHGPRARTRRLGLAAAA